MLFGLGKPFRGRRWWWWKRVVGAQRLRSVEVEDVLDMSRLHRPSMSHVWISSRSASADVLPGSSWREHLEFNQRRPKLD